MCIKVCRGCAEGVIRYMEGGEVQRVVWRLHGEWYTGMEGFLEDARRDEIPSTVYGLDSGEVVRAMWCGMQGGTSSA